MTWGYNGCESVQPRVVCVCELFVCVRERERESAGGWMWRCEEETT